MHSTTALFQSATNEVLILCALAGRKRGWGQCGSVVSGDSCLICIRCVGNAGVDGVVSLEDVLCT